MESEPSDGLCLTRFSCNHGENVVLMENNTVAYRKASFADAVTVSAQPVRPGEIFLVEIEQTEPGWTGHMRLGLTQLQPSAPLPLYSLPDMSNRGDSWICAITKHHNMLRTHTSIMRGDTATSSTDASTALSRRTAAAARRARLAAQAALAGYDHTDDFRASGEDGSVSGGTTRGVTANGTSANCSISSNGAATSDAPTNGAATSDAPTNDAAVVTNTSIDQQVPTNTEEGRLSDSYDGNISTSTNTNATDSLRSNTEHLRLDNYSDTDGGEAGSVIKTNECGASSNGEACGNDGSNSSISSCKFNQDGSAVAGTADNGGVCNDSCSGHNNIASNNILSNPVTNTNYPNNNSAISLNNTNHSNTVQLNNNYNNYNSDNSDSDDADQPYVDCLDRLTQGGQVRTCRGLVPRSLLLPTAMRGSVDNLHPLPTDEGSRIGLLYLPHSSGYAEMHYIINGEDQGVFTRLLPYGTAPLHAVVDVYGTTKRVRIIQLYGVLSLKSACKATILQRVPPNTVPLLPLPPPLQHYILSSH